MDGILVVAKEPGYTSHDVVAVVRGLTGTRRVGHGGTLDPFASGVLPVFLGLATRFVEYHMGDPKSYRATVCFGARSDTDDRGGQMVDSGLPGPSRSDVEAALEGFRGTIEQRPPAFSALKVGGRRAYDLARQGTPPELRPRSVTIVRLEMVSWQDADPGRPAAVLDVECSAGTYIRSLARDLGDRLGCGAFLGELARTASGPFRLAEAHSVGELRAAAGRGASALSRLLLPVDAGLEFMPLAELTDAEAAAASKGQQVKPEARPRVEAGTRVRLKAPGGRLLGIGTWQAGRLVPEKILAAPVARSAEAGRARGRRQVASAGEPPLRVESAKARMAVLNGIAALTSEAGPVYVAVGVFDGLHRGHLYLIRELRRAARRAGARAAVITFDAHPEELIEGLAPPLLCDPDERLVRLAAAGVEVTVVQHFDHALRITTYDRFVEMIRERVGLAGFVMTPDASFGYDHGGKPGGTPQTLAILGQRDGFGVTVVPSYLSNGEQVRSSEIRRRAASGDLTGARSLLGRPLSVTGRVSEPPGPSGALAVAFDLPVCLPPDGHYEGLVGPAWSLEGGHDPATTAARVSVSPDGVTLESAAAPAGESVRIVFLGPGDGPAV
jgi:tRNA pseudouridine55 synthase